MHYAVGKFNKDGSCVMQISLQDTQTLSSFSSKSVPLSSSIFKWIGERFESFLTSALPSRNV